MSRSDTGGAAVITFAEPVDEVENQTCRHCPDEVIRNYDGRGTGWSHIWPEGHALYLRSGTKECRRDPKEGER